MYGTVHGSLVNNIVDVVLHVYASVKKRAVSLPIPWPGALDPIPGYGVLQNYPIFDAKRLYHQLFQAIHNNNNIQRY